MVWWQVVTTAKRSTHIQLCCMLLIVIKDEKVRVVLVGILEIEMEVMAVVATEKEEDEEVR